MSPEVIVTQSGPAFGLSAFALAYLALAVSPGQNFLVVCQAGMTGSRRTALMAAAGVATGAGILAICLSWLSSTIALDREVTMVFTTLIAALLVSFGLGLIIEAVADHPALKVSAMPGRTFFWLGFATALLNPATAAFVTIYGLRLAGPEAAPSSAAAVIFVIALCWFSLVGWSIAAPPARALYQRWRRPITGLAGLALIYVSYVALSAQMAVRTFAS